MHWEPLVLLPDKIERQGIEEAEEVTNNRIKNGIVWRGLPPHRVCWCCVIACHRACLVSWMDVRIATKWRLDTVCCLLVQEQDLHQQSPELDSVRWMRERVDCVAATWWYWTES
jgi:hypothetical protein